MGELVIWQIVIAGLGLLLAALGAYAKWLSGQLTEEKHDRREGDADLWKAVNKDRDDARGLERDIMARLERVVTRDDLEAMEKRLQGWVHGAPSDLKRQ